MKGAVFHTAFGAVGGAELLAAAQTRLLRESGLDLEVVTFGFKADLWEALFDQVPVHRIPRRAWTDLLALRASSKWEPRVARAMARLRIYDTIIAHGQPLASLLGQGDLAARGLWYCHEAPWRLHPDTVEYRLLGPLPTDSWLDPFRLVAKEIRSQSERLAKRRLQDLEGTARLDGLATNSTFARAALHAIYGVREILVIPPIIRFPEVVQPRQGLRRGGLGVLVQSRLGLLKNVEAVFRGFATYAAKAGVSAHLHVVGDGEDRARLEGLIPTLALRGKVTFHGALDPVSDRVRLDAVYSACDVFALLPLDESFGMVFPEAAARGLLLLGPDQGGPVEILEGGQFGACLPVFEPEVLAEALDAIERLPDASVDARRREADTAFRSRYGRDAILPMLRTWVLGGSDVRTGS